MTTVDFGLPLVEAARRAGTTVSMETAPRDGYIQSGDVRLHYLDWNLASGATGTRPVVLCLHGFAQNAHMWDFTALAFAHKHRVIALDQRGHGDSEWSPKQEYSLEAYQRDLATVVAQLKLDRFILVGLSMGGRNAFTHAAANPEEVRALVVVDAGPESRREGVQRIRQFTSQDDVLDSFDAFVQRTLRYVSNRPEWMVRGSLRNNLKQLPDGRWTWKYDPLLRDPGRRSLPPQQASGEKAWETWRSIRCPTLIVRGAQSDVLPAEVAKRMEHALDGRAQLVEVPHAGHLVPGDNPPAFEVVLRRFLELLEK